MKCENAGLAKCREVVMAANEMAVMTGERVRAVVEGCQHSVLFYRVIRGPFGATAPKYSK